MNIHELANEAIMHIECGQVAQAKKMITEIVDISAPLPEPYTVKEIVDAVCVVYDVTEHQVLGKSRKREIVEARHMAMYLIRKHCRYSLIKIGMLIGNRDHSTVIHANANIDGLLDVDKSVRTAHDNVISHIDFERAKAILEVQIEKLQNLMEEKQITTNN